MTKKKLLEENELLKNEIAHMDKEIKELKKQRTALVNEMSARADIDKAEKDVFFALADNIKKSLAAKKAVNMKPEEKDSIYYLLESFDKMDQHIKVDLIHCCF